MRSVAQATMVVLLSFAGTSCGTSEPPYLAYRAEFNKSMAPDAERHLREIASQWDLVLHEQSKSVTGGADVFVTFMYYDDRSYGRGRATVFARNHDLGTDDDPDRSLVSLHIYDDGHIPLDVLDHLAFEIKHTMEYEFGLRFCRLNPATSICDEQYRKLEEAREARLTARDWHSPG